MPPNKDGPTQIKTRFPNSRSSLFRNTSVLRPIKAGTPALNVLMVTPVFPPNITVGGGVAVTCGALVDKLRLMGHSVRVISPSLGNVDYGTSQLYPSFPVMFPTFRNLRFFHESIVAADIIVCPDNTVMPFLLFLAHYHNKPIFFNLHTNVRQLLSMTGVFGTYVSGPACDWWIRLASRMTCRTFTTSPSYKQVLLERGYAISGVFSPRIKLAVFEFDSDTSEDIQEARRWLSNGKSNLPLCLYVGRYSHEKRISLLARTMPPGVVLAIVGDGPGKAGDDIAALHDPANNIFVHRGMVCQERLRVLYKASDFLVSASSFETLGMTVAEANCCGTPVLVQRATGFNTQVIDGENGFLVDFESPNITVDILSAFRNQPRKETVLKVSKEKRWDADLPNLEDEVVRAAFIGADKSQWSSGEISMWIFMPVIFIFFCMFKVLTFPFNTLTHVANNNVATLYDKEKPAPKCSN